MFSGDRYHKVCIFNRKGEWSWANEGWVSPVVERNPEYMGEIPMKDIITQIDANKYNL